MMLNKIFVAITFLLIARANEIRDLNDGIDLFYEYMFKTGPESLNVSDEVDAKIDNCVAKALPEAYKSTSEIIKLRLNKIKPIYERVRNVQNYESAYITDSFETFAEIDKNVERCVKKHNIIKYHCISDRYESAIKKFKEHYERIFNIQNPEPVNGTQCGFLGDFLQMHFDEENYVQEKNVRKFKCRSEENEAGYKSIKALYESQQKMQSLQNSNATNTTQYVQGILRFFSKTEMKVEKCVNIYEEDKYGCIYQKSRAGFEKIQVLYHRQISELDNVKNINTSTIAEVFEEFSEDFVKTARKKYEMKKVNCYQEAYEFGLEKVKALYERQRREFRNGLNSTFGDITAFFNKFFDNLDIWDYRLKSPYECERIVEQTFKKLEECAIVLKNMTKYESCITDEMSNCVKSVTTLYGFDGSEENGFNERITAFKNFYIKWILLNKYLLITGAEGERIFEGAIDKVINCYIFPLTWCNLENFDAIINSLKTLSESTMSSVALP